MQRARPATAANYTNKKVIVARSYVPMIAAGSNPANPAADSSPDDYSARDRDGHGSAVAAAAAGVQNNAGSVPFSGMAPKAYLGSYKIYGSPGVGFGPPEIVLIKALDDAVERRYGHHQHVFGRAGFCRTRSMTCSAATPPAYRAIPWHMRLKSPPRMAW